MNELDFAGMEKMLEQKTAEKKDFEQFAAAVRAETFAMYHQPTSPRGNKERGVGITRKNRSASKKAKKLAKKQRKINRQRK